jgi:hypothetical protein
MKNLTDVTTITRTAQKFQITREQLEYELFALELPVRQIAKKYGCNRSCLDRCIEKWKITPLPSRLERLLTKEQLEADLFFGLSVKQMAKKYSCGEVVIKKRIKKFGLSWLSNTGGSIQVRNLRIQKVGLTPRQRSIIIGSILGDGYISRYVSKVTGKIIGNTEIQMCQCKERKDYLLWKARELEPFTKSIYQDKRYLTYYVNTVRYDLFNEFYNLFIKDGRKSVPENISDYLDELALTVWFMDDGHTDCMWSNLCTQSFTLRENGVLAKAVKERFGVEARVKTCRRSVKYTGYNYYLSFPSVESRKLHAIIDSLFHPCFGYKKIKSGKVIVD